MISYKLELGLQGESVDGQEAIEGSSIDQLYDKNLGSIQRIRTAVFIILYNKIGQ